MALNITHAEADRLARELSAVTGKTPAATVPEPSTNGEILSEVRLRLSCLRVLDTRSADEILGYDETGLPH
jgi:antitoxin VapB